jgi:3' exoribonuclease, RNase T-like
MTIHATIDLETLDTSPSATILTIGGVKFNPYTVDEPYDKFYFKLSIDDQDRLGRTVSDSTLEWWTKQDPEIMNEAFDQTDAVGVDEFLNALNKWIVGVDIFWGQGYGFDYTMLENIYRSLGRPIPWQFWQIRDSRTLLGLLKEDPRKKMQKNLHNAYADAFYQSKAIQIAYSDLGVTQWG